ncbi:MAG TPA: glycosyltransferase family 39 protein [Elusimicrobiota bacterium]|nr:glycosyltransferase family 39 protein [Elusimicrobiota bacterium]
MTDARADAPAPRTAWLLAAVAAGAAALRLWGLRSQALYIDEYFEAFAAWKPRSLGQLLDILRDNPLHALLGPLANHVWGRWLETPELLRLPNALLGAATVVPLYFLGRRIGGRRTGLLSALLLAGSLLHAEWSRRTPFYPPMVLETVLSVLALLRGLEGTGAAALAPWAALQILFTYTHPYAFAAMALEGAWVAAVRRADLKRWASWAAAVVMAYLPWHAFAAHQLLERRYFYFNELYGWHPLRDAARALLVWGQASEGAFPMFPAGARAASVAAAALYAALAAAGLARLGRRGSGPWSLAALWVPGGLAAVLLLDRVFSYNFFPRQTLFALPFYLILVAEGAGALLDRLGGKAWAAGGLALAWLLVSALPQLANQRALAAIKRVRGEVERRTLEGTGEDEVLLFAEPNNAQMFLLDVDRAAFLRAEHPRMNGGFYQFRLPDELVATRAGRSRRVFSIVRPGASLEEERARWRALVGGPGSTARLAYVDSAKPLPGDEPKLRAFEEFVRGLAPKPGR